MKIVKDILNGILNGITLVLIVYCLVNFIVGLVYCNYNLIITYGLAIGVIGGGSAFLILFTLLNKPNSIAQQINDLEKDKERGKL